MFGSWSKLRESLAVAASGFSSESNPTTNQIRPSREGISEQRKGSAASERKLGILANGAAGNGWGSGGAARVLEKVQSQLTATLGRKPSYASQRRQGPSEGDIDLYAGVRLMTMWERRQLAISNMHSVVVNKANICSMKATEVYRVALAASQSFTSYRSSLAEIRELTQMLQNAVRAAGTLQVTMESVATELLALDRHTEQRDFIAAQRLADKAIALHRTELRAAYDDMQAKLSHKLGQLEAEKQEHRMALWQEKRDLYSQWHDEAMMSFQATGELPSEYRSVIGCQRDSQLKQPSVEDVDLSDLVSLKELENFLEDDQD